MTNTDSQYKKFIAILKEELIPAMGCTEPVALAFAAAKAVEVLGKPPERLLLQISGNIFKNLKSVVVPNTGGRKGMKTSVAAGAVVGNTEKKLELLANLSEDQQRLIADFLDRVPIEIEMVDSGRVLEIIVSLFAGESWARVRIIDAHTNIVSIEKDGKFLFKEKEKLIQPNETDRTALNIKDIVDFADSVNIEDVRELIERQIEYNSIISAEGLRGD